MSPGRKAPTPPPDPSTRPPPPPPPPSRKPEDPIGTPGELARGVTMRCHRGHTSPAGLWNCPVCTDPTLDAVRKVLQADWDWAIAEARRLEPVRGQLALSTWLAGVRERLTKAQPKPEGEKI